MYGLRSRCQTYLMTSLFLEGTIPHMCFGEVYLLDFRVPRSCTQAQYCCCTTPEYVLELGLPWRDQRQCVRWLVSIFARNISFRKCVSGERICDGNRVLCCFITRLIIEFLPVAVPAQICSYSFPTINDQHSWPMPCEENANRSQNKSRSNYPCSFVAVVKTKLRGQRLTRNQNKTLAHGDRDTDWHARLPCWPCVFAMLVPCWPRVGPNRFVQAENLFVQAENPGRPPGN